MTKKLESPAVPAFIGLVLLLVVVQWSRSVLDDPKPDATNVSSAASAMPTAPVRSSAQEEPKCPTGLDLPSGVDLRVCKPVAADDLTSIKPTAGPDGMNPVAAFRSPGGSLACASAAESKGTSTVECAVASWTFAGRYPYPGGKSDRPASHDTALVLATGNSDGFTQAPPGPPTDVRPAALALEDRRHFSPPALPYGQVVRLAAGHYCVIQKVGVACWNPTSRSGLFLSQDRWISWGSKGVLGES